ncbi:hypothetical protein DFH29DRAFT_1068931 [Suillus ampliporus]|nr:hypothetical protein DFH29DRAFT_1068931 [Suillus ampliporus]
MPDERRSQCYCQQCSRHSDGFKYQTHQVIAKHRKKYGPGPKAQGYQQLKRVPSIRRPLAPQTNVAEPAGPHVVEGPIEEYYGEHEIQAHDDHELQYNADQFEGGNNEAHPVPELPDHPPAAEGQINQELPLIRRWQQQLPAPDQNFALVDLPNIQRRDAKGRLVRTAVKINPQTSLIGSLQRMLMRPGFARSIRDSRNDIPRQNDDKNFVMTDIHDGTLWHELETNIVREVGEFGAIRDWPREGRNRQNLTEHCWTASDDYHLLRQSYYSRDANPLRQKAILDDHGVRWVILNLVAGWFPSKKTALDFMHCVFLGIIAHLFMRVLFGGYMFSGVGGRNSPKQRFEALINSVNPSHDFQGQNNIIWLVTLSRRVKCEQPTNFKLGIALHQVNSIVEFSRCGELRIDIWSHEASSSSLMLDAGMLLLAIFAVLVLRQLACHSNSK